MFISSNLISSQLLLLPAEKNAFLIQVHYECSLEDGTIIDDGCGSTTTSEKQKQRPFQFILGEKHIIQGLEVAIQRMSVGQYAEITVPHLYAYGHKGHYPTIPPRSTLIFQLELIKILSK